MNEWISIKDALPKEFVDVLVCAINLSDITFAIGEKYHAIDRWVIWNDEYKPSFRTDRFFGKVIFWMPLPELPKDKNELPKVTI